MSQQPKQPVRALAHTNSPQRNRITQVREQREIRDAARCYFRIAVTLQISVVKHTQPRRSQNPAALRVKTNCEIDFFHSVRDGQRNVASRIKESLTPEDACTA